MSETTPTPEPGHSTGPSDPTAPPSAPEPTTWTPPDPLTAPQPWAPPAPWAPAPWTPAPPASAAPGDAPNPWASSAPATPGATPDPWGQPGSAAPGNPPPGSGAAPGAAGWTPPHYPNNPGGTPRPAVPAPGPAGAPPVPPWPGGAPGPGWPPVGYPPPYAYPTGAPPRSSGGWVVPVVVTVVIALVLAFCGCVGLGVLGSFVDDSTTSGQPYDPEFDEPDGGLADDPTPTAAAPPVPATTPSGGRGRYTVVYEVTGTGAANVDFYDANGDFLHVDGMRPPWRLAFTTNDRKHLQIVALPDNQRRDGLTCRITIDGKVVSRDSSATGGIATCFGW
ncbi:MmpS family transport accessory protein [Micromonospora chersina]